MPKQVTRREMMGTAALAGVWLAGRGVCAAGRSPNEKLQWDAKNLRAVNCPKADRLLGREYRRGWSLGMP